MTQRKVRFVPNRVAIRDFRKFAKRELGELPKKADEDNIYVSMGMTLEDLQVWFDAGYEARERRERIGGAGCGE